MNSSGKSQRDRIERGLIDNPHGLTSIQFYEEFDIQQPSARIWELRWNKGLNIKTIKTTATTTQGNKHSNARYVLLPGTWQGSSK